VSAFRTLYSGAFAVSSITPLVPPMVDSRQTCRIRWLILMLDKFDRVLGLDLILGLETNRRWHIRLAHWRRCG